MLVDRKVNCCIYLAERKKHNFKLGNCRYIFMSRYSTFILVFSSVFGGYISVYAYNCLYMYRKEDNLQVWVLFLGAIQLIF